MQEEVQISGLQPHLDKHLEMAGFTESWVVVANGPQTLSANHKRLYYGTISLVKVSLEF